MRFQRAQKVFSHLKRFGDFGAVDVVAQAGAHFLPASLAINRSSTVSTSAASALVEEFAALALKLRNGSGKCGKAQRNASRSTSHEPPNRVPLTSRRAATCAGAPPRNRHSCK